MLLMKYINVSTVKKCKIIQSKESSLFWKKNIVLNFLNYLNQLLLQLVLWLHLPDAIWS